MEKSQPGNLAQSNRFLIQLRSLEGDEGKDEGAGIVLSAVDEVIGKKSDASSSLFGVVAMEDDVIGCSELVSLVDQLGDFRREVEAAGFAIAIFVAGFDNHPGKDLIANFVLK